MSLHQTPQFLVDIPADAPAFMDVVILRLVDAIAAPTKTEAMQLAPQLSELVKKRMAILPVEVRRSLREVLSQPQHACADSQAIIDVYRLGQLAFAQNLFHTIVGKRMEDDILATIRRLRYRKYLRVLRKEDLSAEQVATTLAVSVRTVKKRYDELIETGAVTWQKEGKETVFLLTPLGHEVYAMGLHKKK